MHRTITVLALSALGACHTPAHDDAFAIVDAAARDAGVAIEIDGIDRTSALPVSVREGESLTAWLPTGPVQLAPLPGEVVRIAGGDVTTSFLGEDVATDALVLTGTPEAAEELSLLVGADLRGDVILADELLFAVADLDAPAGLDEVLTLRPGDTRRPARESGVYDLPALHTSGRGSASSTTVHHVITAVLPTRDTPKTQGPTDVTKSMGEASGSLFRNPMHVGVYVGRDLCLILDASGNAGPCDAEVRTHRWSSEPDAVVLRGLLDAERLPFTDASAQALVHAAGPLTRVENR